jgi:mannose-6-phosphate isomerase-like protein (cupin superfamily)
MIYGKVWGQTESLLVTPMIEVHRIFTKSGYKCSEHLHKHKWNGFYCINGQMNIYVRKNDYEHTDKTELMMGDFTTVKPGEYHWFECVEDAEVLEIYYAEPISEDIVRKNTGGIISK